MTIKTCLKILMMCGIGRLINQDHLVEVLIILIPELDMGILRTAIVFIISISAMEKLMMKKKERKTMSDVYGL